jgi:hypothetical protein
MPAAAMRDPCRNEECWKAPDCLYPTYKRKDVSEALLLDGIAALDTCLTAYLLPAVGTYQPGPRNHFGQTYKYPLVTFLHATPDEMIEDYC